MSKKHDCIAMSSAEAEYVTLSASSAQCKLFPLLGKLSTVSVFLGFGLTYAEKGEYNSDFHPMVDFLEASPLRYALTVKPTMYVSHIRQFWSTARIETTKEGTKILATVDDFLEASPLRYALTVKPTMYVSHIRQFWSTARIETTKEGTKILATVDGIVHSVSKSSLRRNLKLRDEDGISLLPDVELFENLTLMGYNISPNQKVKAQEHQLSLITHPLLWLKHLYILFNPHHHFHLFLQPPFQLLPPLKQHQSGEACPTDSGFIADQDGVTIAKSSTLPHDSAPRVTSPIADEGSMQPNITELTVLCTSLERQHSELLAKFQAQEVEILKLKERVKVLEDRKGIAATRSGDNAPIKGKSMDEGEAATKRISNDTEEMVIVLTSIDAVTVLARGINDVSTGNGSIPTAGPPAADIPIGSEVVPTASLVFATAIVVTLYSRRKGKKVMVEFDTPKKQRLQEQIDAQVARELEEQ
nr:hypothetical protein [Tanacetum cinerariifolium]